jgi:hypothetical protein
MILSASAAAVRPLLTTHVRRPAHVQRNEYESHSRDSVKLHAPTVGKPPEYIGHRRCRCIQTAPGDVSGYLHDGSRRERDVKMGHSRIEMIE